jgi:hypothetical protein
VPKVGDQIELAATKVSQAPRTGVVTGVSGRMITVRWPSGEQSIVVPAPGTLTVIGRKGGTPGRSKVQSAPSRRAKASKRVPAARTLKTTGAKPDKPVVKKAAPKKAKRKAPVPKTVKGAAPRTAAQ